MLRREVEWHDSTDLADLHRWLPEWEIERRKERGDMLVGAVFVACFVIGVLLIGVA